MVHSPNYPISKQTFVLLQWIPWSVASCFLILRLYIRVKIFRRLKSDDILTIAAWAFFLAHITNIQTQVDVVYEIIDLEQGTLPTDPSRFPTEAVRFAKSDIAFKILFTCSLWSVKLGFLAFFRQIVLPYERGHRIWWWIVFTLTIAGGVAAIGDVPYECLKGDYQYLLAHCTSDSFMRNQYLVFLVNTILDVGTDLLILTIPVLILHKVQVSSRIKLGLLVLVSLTVFTMTFALLRFFMSPEGVTPSSIARVFSWSCLEMSVAIIVASLGSFRQLYTKSKSKQNCNQKGGAARMDRRNLASAVSQHVKSITTGVRFGRAPFSVRYSGSTNVADKSHTVSSDDGSEEGFVNSLAAAEPWDDPKYDLSLYGGEQFTEDFKAGHNILPTIPTAPYISEHACSRRTSTTLTLLTPMCHSSCSKESAHNHAIFSFPSHNCGQTLSDNTGDRARHGRIASQISLGSPFRPSHRDHHVSWSLDTRTINNTHNINLSHVSRERPAAQRSQSCSSIPKHTTADQIL